MNRSVRGESLLLDSLWMWLVENQPAFEAEVEPAGRSGGVDLPRHVHARSDVDFILDRFAVSSCSQRSPANTRWGRDTVLERYRYPHVR